MANHRQSVERKNKIVAFILILLAILSVSGAVLWFKIYAPLVIY